MAGKRLFDVSAALLVSAWSVNAIPADPYNFTQIVDHFDSDVSTFQQRYYKNETWFAGPGSPILCIIGGEGAVPPDEGIFYPFVTDVLAKRFSALVIEPEHRFYGTSLPLGADSFTNEALRLATPQQALGDIANFIKGMQDEYGCTARGTEGYCPVITIGGSYPGWLSAMARLRYPAVVDFAYSASAPMLFYAQEVDQYAYYEVVTNSAEKSVEGCASAVRTTLNALALLNKEDTIESLNICEPLPDYLVDADDDFFMQEIQMIFMFTFANLNMGNYPPSNSDLQSTCNDFIDNSDSDPYGVLSRLLMGYGSSAKMKPSSYGYHNHVVNNKNSVIGGGGGDTCFDLATEVPNGSNATISGGDWSGCGAGADGELWDYETCGFLVETIGVNGETDMFVPRSWEMDWLESHCMSRFEVTPQPTALVDEWGFSPSQLEATGATHILFTNGLNDGWSAGGITTNLSETSQLLAINMVNGAHHSDLTHVEPDPDVDTADVTQARNEISDLLARWLSEL
jgi:pimeloyl-ACP methyl ester carboxylesterase